MFSISNRHTHGGGQEDRHLRFLSSCAAPPRRRVLFAFRAETLRISTDYMVYKSVRSSSISQAKTLRISTDDMVYKDSRSNLTESFYLIMQKSMHYSVFSCGSGNPAYQHGLYEY